MKKYLIFSIILYFILPILPAQEALKSVEEEYYDFLALQGLAERPFLNYRTLSDSVWNITDNAVHPWQGQNFGTWYDLFGNFRLRVYGPELFVSGNTEAPYGQNDGVLWQGRGFNALLKGGVRFEGYGVELTLLPHFAFSQNAEFDIIPQTYYDSIYGYYWGLDKNIGIDAPQRFGDKPFFDWDFGDSEIRYTWKTLTVGFGTQTIWLGPSYLNSILHSNNASAYPKFDIGLRRQRITLPLLDWYIGDVEFRLWVGQLAESDYFDSDDSNNYTMFHGFSFAYSPSFLEGFTLYVNRVCLVPWEWKNLKYFFPVTENTIEDQKASFGFSWIFPQVGFELFGEIGVDDYVGDITSNLRRPFHTTVYNTGLKKVLKINPEKKIYGEIIFESNWMEMTQDFQFQWPYSFYFHHELTHGYTNKGQWLGNASSPGGNSQYLSFSLYYPNGNSSLFISRNNPDNNFIFRNAISNPEREGYINEKYFKGYMANFNIGINTNYFLNSYLLLSGGIVQNLKINPYYYFDKSDTDDPDGYKVKTYLYNYSFQLSLKFIF